MGKLMEILSSAKPECDFENSNDYLEDGYFDSLTIITVLADIETICDIKIDILDIEEEDFISEDSILKMVERFGGNADLLK